ncbi:MAG: ATP-binding cassette domain-containing protein [Bdellovibrionales bacterium]|nr:ATP-binding cassette domain-containing protein [Bdellovibrionales bacterium]
MREKSLISIHLNQVSVSYDSTKTALLPVTYDVPMGKVIRATGQPGSGKSTFLKLLMGLQMPTSGSLLINGMELAELSFEEFLPLRLKMGFSFEHGGLIYNKSLYENVTLPLEYHRNYRRKEIRQRAESIFAFFGIGEERHQRPAMVIGGLRKLTCVMRAFVHAPELVLLDDPATGLSPAMKSRLADWIGSYRMIYPDSTIVFTTDDEFLLSKIPHETIELQYPQKERKSA